MTLTHTVTSLAHDAAKSAGEIGSQLGSQAKELGKSAAEIGSDAAANVASAASNLAQSLAQKVPGVKPKRHVPWGWIAIGLAAVVGVAAALKSKRGTSEQPNYSGARDQTSTPATSAPLGEAAMT